MNKKQLNGRITISRPNSNHPDWENKIHIQVIDENSQAIFLDILINYDEFTKAITGQSVPMKFEKRQLENVGLHKVSELIEFELPVIGAGNDITRESLAEAVAKKLCDKTEWKPDLSFNSRNSFFEKDNKTFARTYKYKFVNKK